MLKKTTYSLLLITFSFFSEAQITTSEVKVEEIGDVTSIEGKVGIGTTAPAHDLQIVGVNSSNATIRLQSGEGADTDAVLDITSRGSNGRWLNTEIRGIGKTSHGGTLTFSTDDTNGVLRERMRINEGGSVGIGTLNPFYGTGNFGIHLNKGNHSSLILGDPVGSNYGGILQTSDSRHRIFIGANLYDDHTGSWSSFSTGKGSAGISIIADEGGWGSSIQLLTSTSDGHYNPRLTIKNDGKIGIATATPAYTLDVNGSLNAQSLHNSGVLRWSDFVFYDDYKLPTLTEVEKHIKKHGHLKDIPSEKEVIENGYELGNMDAKLLQKIEELTLYVIELNRENSELVERLNKQEAATDKLIKQITKLKKSQQP